MTGKRWAMAATLAAGLGGQLTVAEAAATPGNSLKPSANFCSASLVTTANAGYVDCIGSFDGNPGNRANPWSEIFARLAQAPVSDKSGGLGFVATQWFPDSSFDALSNPFAQNEGARDDGVINFDNGQTGRFVLGLKQGDAFSFYLFDGSRVAGGIVSLNYDTLGVWKRGGTGLSHAMYVGDPTMVAPVPEPSTYALMIAGLAAVGWMARRRKSPTRAEADGTPPEAAAYKA